MRKTLEQENEELKEENQKLKEQIKKIKKEFEETKKDFEEFKSKHAQTVDELQKFLNIKPNIVSKPKPLGAQKGHVAYVRKIPERVDYIRTLTLKKCPHCKTKLREMQATRRRYVTDVKITATAKTFRYDIGRYYFTLCKKLIKAQVHNVLPHAKFGLNLMLLVMYLRLGLRLPGNKVREFLSTMYNLTVSEGEIVHILKQLVIAFGPYYSELEKMIRVARVKHTDSTSWRVNGKNYFAWVFIATGVVLYKIRKRNNSRVALSVFGTKQ